MTPVCACAQKGGRRHFCKVCGEYQKSDLSSLVFRGIVKGCGLLRSSFVWTEECLADWAVNWNKMCRCDTCCITNPLFNKLFYWADLYSPITVAHIITYCKDRMEDWDDFQYPGTLLSALMLHCSIKICSCHHLQRCDTCWYNDNMICTSA